MPHLLIYSRPSFVLKLPMSVITMEKRRIYIISFYVLLEAFITENVVWEREHMLLFISIFDGGWKEVSKQYVRTELGVWMTANCLLAAWYWGKLSLGLKILYSSSSLSCKMKTIHLTSCHEGSTSWCLPEIQLQAVLSPAPWNTSPGAGLFWVEGGVTRAGLWPLVPGKACWQGRPLARLQELAW